MPKPPIENSEVEQIREATRKLAQATRGLQVWQIGASITLLITALDETFAIMGAPAGQFVANVIKALEADLITPDEKVGIA